jgi:type II secretory pathway predicted ATPase ExeA
MAFHLSPLGLEETGEYIKHRLKVGGRDALLFLPEAVEALYRHSKGVPRVINTIATGALLNGLGAGALSIDGAAVEDFVKDIDLAGI